MGNKCDKPNVIIVLTALLGKFTYNHLVNDFGRWRQWRCEPPPIDDNLAAPYTIFIDHPHPYALRGSPMRRLPQQAEFCSDVESHFSSVRQLLADEPSKAWCDFLAYFEECRYTYQKYNAYLRAHPNGDASQYIELLNALEVQIDRIVKKLPSEIRDTIVGEYRDLLSKHATEEGTTIARAEVAGNNLSMVISLSDSEDEDGDVTTTQCLPKTNDSNNHSQGLQHQPHNLNTNTVKDGVELGKLSKPAPVARLYFPIVDSSKTPETNTTHTNGKLNNGLQKEASLDTGSTVSMIPKKRSLSNNLPPSKFARIDNGESLVTLTKSPQVTKPSSSVDLKFWTDVPWCQEHEELIRSHFDAAPLPEAQASIIQAFAEQGINMPSKLVAYLAYHYGYLEIDDISYDSLTLAFDYAYEAKERVYPFTRHVSEVRNDIRDQLDVSLLEQFVRWGCWFRYHLRQLSY